MVAAIGLVIVSSDQRDCVFDEAVDVEAEERLSVFDEEDMMRRGTRRPYEDAQLSLQLRMELVRLSLRGR